MTMRTIELVRLALSNLDKEFKNPNGKIGSSIPLGGSLGVCFLYTGDSSLMEYEHNTDLYWIDGNNGGLDDGPYIISYENDKNRTQLYNFFSNVYKPTEVEISMFLLMFPYYEGCLTAVGEAWERILSGEIDVKYQ